MLGCVRFNDAEELDSVLNWMDENTDGKPYGVDIVMPAKIPTEGTRPTSASPFRTRTASSSTTVAQAGRAAAAGRRRPGCRGRTRLAALGRAIPRGRRAAAPDQADRQRARFTTAGRDRPRARQGVPVAALAGKAKHARSHVDNGVDIVIAQGTEAGGNTGEIATMVLVPEIVDAVGEDAVVLAAGGIGSGRQIAAALALGAGGVWMGSYWLTAAETRWARARR